MIRSNWYSLRDETDHHEGYIKVDHLYQDIRSCHVFLRDDGDHALMEYISSFVVGAFHEHGDLWIFQQETQDWFKKHTPFKIEERQGDPCEGLSKAAFHWSLASGVNRADYSRAVDYLHSSPVGMLVEDGRVDMSTALDIISMTLRSEWDGRD